MEVRVDGSRSSSENWLRASLAPSQELPKMSADEEEVARKLGISLESYARSRYAGELTAVELRQKAESLGRFVEKWLAAQHVPGSVDFVWLKTFEGKYRIDVELNGKHKLIFIGEALVEDVFEKGSDKTEKELQHIMELNILPAEAVRAS
jgi:hypothetical protein